MAVEPDAMPASAAGSLACLHLLEALRTQGLRRLVLCPGSRSAPLAVAASLLEPRGLALHTAIDERSAAFFALGLARGGDRPVAVVTTSGSAVANLLPALVEADQGTIPLLLLTADRPERLKGCGANQTVSQEAFLVPCCRWVAQGAPQGLATMAPEALERLAHQAMAAAAGQGSWRTPSIPMARPSPGCGAGRGPPRRRWMATGLLPRRRPRAAAGATCGWIPTSPGWWWRAPGGGPSAPGQAIARRWPAGKSGRGGPCSRMPSRACGVGSMAPLWRATTCSSLPPPGPSGPPRCSASGPSPPAGGSRPGWTTRRAPRCW
jgi:hypothetical protein